MGEVAEVVADEEIQQKELEISIAYCDKMIAEGDERGMFAMIKRGLLSNKFEFEEWNKSVKKNRRIEL